jgi:hypothetical protein
MTRGEVTAFLRRVTYKPGWVLDTRHVGEGQLCLQWTFLAPCAVTGEPSTQLTGMQLVEPAFFDNEKAVERFVRHQLRNIELHELDEFFKVDGIAPYYPH